MMPRSAGSARRTRRLFGFGDGAFTGGTRPYHGAVMDLRRIRPRRLLAPLAAALVVGGVVAVSTVAGAAGPAPVPAKVVVPASTVKPVHAPLAAAANAGDPSTLGAPGTEGSDGTTGGADLGADGTSVSDGVTAPNSDPNAADDPEGQFGPTDSSGTVLDPNAPGSTDPSLGMTP